MGGQLTGEPGFADARLAGDERNTALAGDCLREGVPQHAQLVVSPADYGAQHTPHPSSVA